MPHPWFWDFESGAASMLRDDVAISQPESYADILGLVQAVDASKDGKITLADRSFNCCSIIIDACGEMCRVIEGTAKGSKEQATLPEWYLTIERFRKIARQLRNARQKGFNVVFISHEQYITDAVGALVGRPDLPGKELPVDLPQLIDIVGHLTVKPSERGLERILTCEPVGVFIGRDRRGKIGKLTVDFKDPAATAKMLVEQGGAVHICQLGG